MQVEKTATQPPLAFQRLFERDEAIIATIYVFYVFILVQWCKHDRFVIFVCYVVVHEFACSAKHFHTYPNKP